MEADCPKAISEKIKLMQAINNRLSFRIIFVFNNYPNCKPNLDSSNIMNISDYKQKTPHF